MQLFKKLLYAWKIFYADARHQRTILFLVILIIGAAIPLTLTLESQNTDNRQHAFLTTDGGGGGGPATFGTCQSGQGFCSSNPPGGHQVLLYQNTVPNTECGTNAANAGWPNGTTVYCIKPQNSYTCSTASSCPPAPPYTAQCINSHCDYNTPTGSSNPCAGAHCGNGTYCGGACGNTGDPSHVYDCQNNQVASDTACSDGCQINSSGGDSCKTGSGGSGGSGGSCTQVNQYPECELGNANACTAQGVPAGHISLVTVLNCGGTTKYQCVDQGPCNQTPQPTATPTPPTAPTNTPVPAGASTAKVVIALPAIGGRNGGNASPHRPTRTITLFFYKPTDDPTDPATTPVAQKTGSVKLDTNVGSLTYGYFINNPDTGISLGNLEGTYKVLIKTDSYLRKQIVPTNGDLTTTYTFTGGQTTSLPKITLIAGDIYPPSSGGSTAVGDNTLDISDYNQLVNLCYGDKSTCPSLTAADLNDDGHIDGIDYNILIRSFNILAQQGSQGGDGE